jgi:hypothetical protein
VSIQSSGNSVGGTTVAARNIISGNSDDGVLIASGVSGMQVQGNFIGTNAAGTSALANSIGVEVAGSNNTIGGTTSAARNIVSGNAFEGVRVDSGVSGVQVQGNLIGTNAADTGALANSIGVYDAGSGNTIGGTATAALNIISGNSSDGVYIAGSDEYDYNNDIGTNLAGTAALANSIGVEVAGSNNTIGYNLISGNSADGVRIDSDASGNTVSYYNYIGTNLAGTAALANSIGVEVAGSNNTINGGNVISGNSGDGVLIDSSGSGNEVVDSWIGTNAAGTSALANGANGVEIAGANNTIGSGNVISGNSAAGVQIDSGVSGVQVQGNYIGTNAAGTSALGNSIGVAVAGSNNTIGGTTTAARNIISGNAFEGVRR